MNTLKLSLFPFLFLYHLIQFLLTKRSIINSTKQLKGTKTMSNQFFNYIQNTPICKLQKLDHGTMLQVIDNFFKEKHGDLLREIGGAKIFYIQALRNQAQTEKRFPNQREMVKQQADHLLQDYIRTQELYNFHLQAQLNAGDLNTYRNRLEAAYAQNN